jgi:tetratricopeptide (TPR) repeat protein
MAPTRKASRQGRGRPRTRETPQYDLAISFAGEDRRVAQKLANELNARYGLVTFFDEDEQARLWGRNLTEYLVDVYKNKARYCVILVSRHYANKRWARHEWKAAQARAWEDPNEVYVLPLRLDDTELPGLLPTVGYLALTRRNFAEVTRTIFEKVLDRSKRSNYVTLADQFYSEGKYGQAQKIVNRREFDENVKALRLRADIFGKQGRYPEAIAALRKILTLRKNDFLCHFLLGIFYHRVPTRENLERATKYYRLARKHSPKHPTILQGLSEATRMLRQRKWIST